MARLNAKWLNFFQRGQSWYHFWQDAKPKSKLYLRNTTLNGKTRGGTPLFDILPVAGTTLDTCVVNTISAGAEIQFTKTAGGTPVAFITPPFAANYTVTGADLAAWFFEMLTTVNSGGRFRIYRWRAGVETEFTGSPADSAVEFDTAASLRAWASSVTALAFLTNDRLLLVPYVKNIGVMAAGTATLNFNSPAIVGTLSASVTDTGSGAVNLTLLGAADYHIFDISAALNVGQRKTGGGSSITVEKYDPSGLYIQDAESLARTASATDASPTAVFSTANVARIINNTVRPAAGVLVTLPADRGVRTAKIYVNAFHNIAGVNNLKAIVTLSDGSAAPVVVPVQVALSNTIYYYTIDVTYNAANNGQTCSVIWQFDQQLTPVTKVVQYLASWVSAPANAANLGNSYLFAYPALVFGSEAVGFNGAQLEAATAAETQAASRVRNAAVTEASSANNTQTASRVRVAQATEAATAGEQQSATKTRIGLQSEAATAADAQAAARVRVATSSEAASAADTQTTTKTRVALSSEPATAVDIQSVMRIRGAAQAEASTAVDTQTASRIKLAALSEAATANNTQSASRVRVATSSEPATAVESTNRTVNKAVSISEASTANDTQSALRSRVATQSEAATALETQAASRVRLATDSEAASANNTQTATRSRVSVQAEAASAAETQFKAGVTLNASQSDAATANNTQLASRARAATQSEAATLAEAISKTASKFKAITESATANNTLTRTVSLNAAQLEAIIAAAVQNKTASKFKVQNEAANAVDFVAASKQLYVIISNALNALDFSSEVASTFVAISEAVVAADLLTKTKATIKNAAITENGFAMDIVFRDSLDYDSRYNIAQQGRDFTAKISVDYNISRGDNKYKISRD